MNSTQVTDANSLFTKLNDIGNSVLGILIAAAVVWLVYNTVRFIMDNGDDRAKYRASIMWGIVGLFVIVSLWGIVNIIDGTFNMGGNTENQAQFASDAKNLILNNPSNNNNNSNNSANNNNNF